MPERVLSLCCRRARERRGLTHKDLAAACGVDVSRISHRENGAVAMCESSLESTAAGLRIPVRLLLLEEIAPEVAILPEERERPARSRVLSQVVRNVIAARGLTQTTLAKKLKIGQPTVSAWVSGQGYIKETTLDAIAAALNISERELLREGLLFAPPPSLDQEALRARYRAAIDPTTGTSIAIRVAQAIGEGRSTLSRFLNGSPISPAVAAKLVAWLDAHAG